MGFLCLSQSRITRIVLLLSLAFLFACGGGQVKQDSQTTQMDAPLAKKYDNIVFFDFETTPEIKGDYPGAAKQSQTSAVSALSLKDVFQRVEEYKPASHYGDRTLFVKARITEMRIVSTSARVWGGAWAGQSYMNLDIRLIDAGTNTEVRRKEMSTANNPYAAAWVWGASDRSLPDDLGKMVGEYIFAVVPHE